MVKSVLQYIAIQLTIVQYVLQYAVYDISHIRPFVVTFTVAYPQEVIKKTGVSAWNSSILSRQFLRKLSII